MGAKRFSVLVAPCWLSKLGALGAGDWHALRASPAVADRRSLAQHSQGYRAAPGLGKPFEAEAGANRDVAMKGRQRARPGLSKQALLDSLE